MPKSDCNTNIKVAPIIITITLFLFLFGCQPVSQPPPGVAEGPDNGNPAKEIEVAATPTASLPAPTPSITGTIQATATGGPVADPNSDSVRQVTVLYTNDEHGWMEGMEAGRGAANLLSLWREEEGYTEDGPFLVLSGGDMWTGPAISTWFEGQSMVEVMNAMGYDAAAVGNHEFDFGLEALRQRITESNFPYLSANTRYITSGRPLTEIGILPFTVVEVNDLQVGLIGLTTTSTPRTTNPVNVTEFTFLDYEAALREVVPQVKAVGVDLILAPGHVCMYELEPLAWNVGDLDIDMLGGGHCNELVAQEVNGIVLLEGGFHLTTYARATFTYDLERQEVIGLDYGVVVNEGGLADANIDRIVMGWQGEAEAELNVVIGYTDQEIAHQSQELQDMVVDAWLFNYPADVAITNLGGLRAPIPPGEITLGDIVGVMPFDNTIIEVQLTGADLLKTIIEGGRPVIGGMEWTGQAWVLSATGEPIEADAEYSVLVNSFMYAGGDGYGIFAQADPDAYDTGIQYRQPLIDWIIDQQSNPSKPLLSGQ